MCKEFENITFRIGQVEQLKQIQEGFEEHTIDYIDYSWLNALSLFMLWNIHKTESMSHLSLNEFNEFIKPQNRIIATVFLILNNFRNFIDEYCIFIISPSFLPYN